MGIIDKLKKTKAAEETTASDAVESKVVAPANMKEAGSGALRVVVRPLVTEKAATHQTLHRAYTFIVAKAANKIEIAKAVKEIYGVEPKSVRVSNIEGKMLKFSKGSGRRSDYKKAVVTLKKGDSITIHEGV